jgi:TonB family protein
MQRSKTLQIAFCISILIHAAGLGIYEAVKSGATPVFFQQEETSLSFMPVATPKEIALQQVMIEKATPIRSAVETVVKPFSEKPVTKPILPSPQPSLISLPAPPITVATKSAAPVDTNPPVTTNDVPQVQVVANVEAKPAYLKNQPPTYPELAQRRGEQGFVLLSVKVTARGSVAEIKVKRSSGFPLLDDAALQAVRAWQFEPAHIGPMAFDSEVDVPLRFRLSSH